MSLAREIHLAFVSDVHLFHPTTPTSHIIHNLLIAFPNNDSTGKLDMVFINGDLFDQIAHLPDQNVKFAMVWMTAFLRMCAKRGIKVRVLEGTPKHDRKQNTIFSDLIAAGEIPVDYRYYDRLTIDYEEDYGIHILYVPDEWSSGQWASNTHETAREIRALMAQKNLEQVDLTCLHGAMRYQLPASVKEHLTHDPAFYEAITRFVVNTGHIHESDHRGKILTNGSFDRLVHGDEKPKGHWRVRLKPGGTYHATFVENKGAMVYKTIRLRELDADKSLAFIKEQLAGLPKGSHVRIWAEKGHPILGGFETLKREYPHFHFKPKTETEEEERANEQALQEEDDDNLGIEITPNNVVGLVDVKLQSLGVDPALRAACMNRLQEDVHGKRI